MNFDYAFLLFIFKPLAGLGLILLGMSFLSESLQGLMGPWIRKLINRIQENPFVSLFVGALVSFLIQSGTSASVMAVSYAGSGLLNLGQIILFLVGANLGTVLTTWFFLIPANDWDLLLLGLGFFPMFYMRGSVLSSLGKVLFSLGLLLVGYGILWHSTLVPRMLIPDGKAWLDTFLVDDFSYAALFAMTVVVSALLAAAVRSTVGLIAMVMALTQSGMISSEVGTIAVLGINVGVTIPAVYLSGKSGLIARRGSLTNLLVNAFGMLGVFVLFDPWTSFMTTAAGALFGQTPLAQVAAIPMAHLFFNVGLVMLASIFYWPLKKLMLWLIPERDEKTPQHLRFLGSTSHLAPSLAIEQVDQEVKKMAAMVETMLRLTQEEIQSEGRDKENRERLLKYEGITDNIQFEIMVFLSRVMEAGLNRAQSREIRCLLKMADELESIADCCQRTVLSYQQFVQEQGSLKEEIRTQFERFMSATVRTYELVFPLLTEMSESQTESVDIDTSEKFKQLAEQIRKEYSSLLKQMKAYPSEPDASVLLGRLFVNMGQIARHTWSLLEVQASKGVPMRETLLREEGHSILDL